MPFDNGSVTDSFLRSISEGFKRSPEYLFFAFGVMAAIVLLFIFLNAFINARERRKTRDVLNKSYYRLARSHNLTINEMDLLDRMAKYLLDSKKKYLLLTNEHTFSTCLHRLKEEEPLPADVFISLRDKLNFTIHGLLKPAYDTQNLLPAAPVKIELDKGGTINGDIFKNRPDALVLKLAERHPKLRRGTDITLYSHDFRGIHRFRCRIAINEGTHVTLEHSNEYIIPQKTRISGNLNIEIFIKTPLKIPI